ncbi:hypothetical protein [Peloplasma aerotolerans]|uniref:ATP synthase subunit I n=1 Tax=Peloplasma aerotolerans TaxID=3044389 RepID=A0AAW6UAN4_9MOLU|nr:hypothetical protein [Mariniplasma sp. M4Ah]MDI6453492.1 hypothetical protein [Mariniplasma sp. M4Ah]MDR4968219.1 hypothetical protein [Acholeplasmataceae bacterium]
MKELHVISLIALIFATLYTLVCFIFFREYVFYAILGAATSLFSNSLAIAATKGKFTTEKLVVNLMQRYLFYIVIIVFVYFDTKDQSMTFATNSYIFLVIGMFSTKIGIFVYSTPLIKKSYNEKIDEKEDDHDDHVSR